MFKHTYQGGILSILYSLGSNPLQMWRKNIKNGHLKRVSDNLVQSMVLEICGIDVTTSYITCPSVLNKTLEIKLPYFVMNIKNLNKDFTFEVELKDDREIVRRFRASTYQLNARVKPHICTMPLRLDEGWNQVQLDLADMTKKVYGTNYSETLRVHINANCRIRRIYFCDRVYSEEELPAELKLYSSVYKEETPPQEEEIAQRKFIKPE